MKKNNFKKLRHVLIFSVFLFVGALCLFLTGCGCGIDMPNPGIFSIMYK